MLRYFRKKRIAELLSSDLYWDNVVLLMHMDGINGSSTFLDEKAHTVTNIGAPTLTNAPYKFGTTSYATGSSASALKVTNNGDFQLGSGSTDFTIECWLNFSNAANTQTFLSTYLNSTVGLECALINSKINIGLRGDPICLTSVSNIASNTWTHVAIVCLQGVCKLYINGVAEATYSGTVSLNSTSDLYIGASAYNSGSAWRMAGFVDEVRITKGLARYTSNFSVATSQFPHGTTNGYDTYWDNVVFLSHMNNGISDVKGHAITNTGSLAVSAVAARFGVTGLDDSSAAGYLSVAGSTDFAFPGAFTVEYWVKYTASTTYGSMLSIGTYSAGILIRNNSDGLYINNTNCGSPGIPVDSNWHHVALTRDSSNVCRLFVDGTQKLTQTISGTINSSNGGITLGASSHSLSTERMKGYLDEIRITKGVARYTSSFTVPTAAFLHGPVGIDDYWSSVSALLHMNGTNGSTSIVDETGKTVTAYGNAAISTAQYKLGTGSLYVGGAGDYALLASHADFALGTADFTIEACICPTASQALGTFIGGSIANGPVVNLNSLSSISINLNGNSGSTKTFNYSFSLNTWYYIALSRVSGTLYLFVNGVLVSSTSDTNNYVQSDISIGGLSSGAQYFVGYIDEVRITKGVGRYNAGFDNIVNAFASKNALWDVIFRAPIYDSSTLAAGIVFNDSTKMDITINNAQTVAVTDKGAYAGKLYFECQLLAFYPAVGLSIANPPVKSNRMEANTGIMGVYLHGAAYNCTYTGCGYGAGQGFTVGDYIALAIDFSVPKIDWYKISGGTRTLLGTTTTANSSIFAAMPKPWFPAVALESGTPRVKFNLTGPFVVAPPSGYSAYGSVTPDYTVDDFTFGSTTTSGGTETESAAVTLSGFNQSLPISISGGQYKIYTAGAWGSYTTAAGTVSNGDKVMVKATAPSTVGDTTVATVTIGSGGNAKTGTFSVGASLATNHLSSTYKHAAITLTNDMALHTSSGWVMGRANVAVSSGKRYWEVKTNGIGYGMYGLLRTDSAADLLSAGYLGSVDKSLGMYCIGGGGGYYNSGTGFTITAAPVASSTNVIGFALDYTTGNLYMYVDGVAFNSGNPCVTGITTPVYPAYCLNTQNLTVTFNFGQSGWWASVPSGYDPI